MTRRHGWSSPPPARRPVSTRTAAARSSSTGSTSGASRRPRRSSSPTASAVSRRAVRRGRRKRRRGDHFRRHRHLADRRDRRRHRRHRRLPDPRPGRRDPALGAAAGADVGAVARRVRRQGRHADRQPARLDRRRQGRARRARPTSSTMRWISWRARTTAMTAVVLRADLTEHTIELTEHEALVGASGRRRGGRLRRRGARSRRRPHGDAAGVLRAPDGAADAGRGGRRDRGRHATVCGRSPSATASARCEIGDAALVAAVAADHRAGGVRDLRAVGGHRQGAATGVEAPVLRRRLRRVGRARPERSAVPVGPSAGGGGAGRGGERRSVRHRGSGIGPRGRGCRHVRAVPGRVRRGQRRWASAEQRVLAADVLGLDRVPQFLEVARRSDPGPASHVGSIVVPGGRFVRAGQVRDLCGGAGMPPDTAWLAASNAGAGMSTASSGASGSAAGAASGRRAAGGCRRGAAGRGSTGSSGGAVCSAQTCG